MYNRFIHKLRKKVFSAKEKGDVVLRLNVRSVELKHDRGHCILGDIQAIDEIIENKFGKIALSGLEAHVYPIVVDNIWDVLSPLFCSEYVQEIFIRGNKIFATIKERRYKVIVENFNPEKFISRIVIKSKARVSYHNPEAESELRGWRLYFKLPLVSEKWELTATRIIDIPDLLDLIDPLLAARMVSLVFKPSTMVIIGPAGSGKTTFLNSFINKVLEVFPLLKVSVIEQVRELRVNGGIVNFSKVNIRNMTTLLRQAIRYERPDLLIVGELRSEEVASWIDAGRNGVATITTFHSPSLLKALSSMSYLLKKDVYNSDVEDVIDLFVICRKYVFPNNIINRGVEEVYYNINGKFYPLFIEGYNLQEEIFNRFAPSKTMLGSFTEIYSMLRRRFGCIFANMKFKDFEPIFVDDFVK